jgi:hypothetical protein
MCPQKNQFRTPAPLLLAYLQGLLGGSAILTAHPGRSADHGDLYKWNPAAPRLVPRAQAIETDHLVSIL